MQQKLRVGLLLDDYDVAAWFFKMVENIIDSDYAEITAVILNDTQPVVMNKTLVEKIVSNRGQLLPRVIRKTLEVTYDKLIERNTYLPNANAVQNTEALLKQVPAIKVKPVQKRRSDYFSDEDVAKVDGLDIDILVRGGFGILRGGILKSAKYGIWSYHHGDNFVNRGGPAGFWESMEGWDETGSILQILTEDLDNGKVLSRSFSCTDSMSVTDSRSGYYWKSLSFMTRKMQELYNSGEQAFFEKVTYDNRHPMFYSQRLYLMPTNAELAKLTFNKLVEKAKVIYNNRFVREQWILMFHLKTEFSSSLWRYKKIIPPKDRFWADPHVIYKDDTYYIFIEELFYNTQKGHISLITMDKKGKYTQPKTIIDKPYHLSYPFVFEHNNTHYMIPESIENNTISLFKCTEFPHKWELEMHLMEDIKAVDTTLFYHNNKWWMFTNIVENDGASTCDELFLYYSDDLLTTDWQPHPLNPIFSDCKVARPAGKIFVENGAIYRPSQDCSKRYGYGFNMNEITVLDENNYAETLVSSVKPNWDKNIIGTHTFNRENRLHIIDAIYKRRR